MTTKNGENARIWQVTRLCCTSGQCVECHKNGTRTRIVHADNITRPFAERCAQGWAAYAPKVEAM